MSVHSKHQQYCVCLHLLSIYPLPSVPVIVLSQPLSVRISHTDTAPSESVPKNLNLVHAIPSELILMMNLIDSIPNEPIPPPPPPPPNNNKQTKQKQNQTHTKNKHTKQTNKQNKNKKQTNKKTAKQQHNNKNLIHSIFNVVTSIRQYLIHVYASPVN